MKRLLFVLLAALPGAMYAQQPFQGTITYNLHASMDKNDAELKLTFAPNKIKVQILEKSDHEKTYMVIDLDSGKVFTFFPETKQYFGKKLHELKTEEVKSLPKTIAGYATLPVDKTETGSGSFLSGLLAGTTTFHVANDLLFPIPQKYSGAPELMMIHNNHIVLGADILGSPRFAMGDESDSASQVVITIEARKIERSTPDLAEFLIPAGFEKQSFNWMGMATDTATVIVDTVFADEFDLADTLAVTPPVKKKTQQDSKSVSPKKTTPVKGEAIKPRKNQK